VLSINLAERACEHFSNREFVTSDKERGNEREVGKGELLPTMIMGTSKVIPFAYLSRETKKLKDLSDGLGANKEEKKEGRNPTFENTFKVWKLTSSQSVQSRNLTLAAHTLEGG